MTESVDNIVWMKCDRATTGFIPDRGLFSKTENYHEGLTSFMGWSGAWFAGVLKALGTKTVRISAGTNRSAEVCGSAAFCGVDGHCSAAAVRA